MQSRTFSPAAPFPATSSPSLFSANSHGVCICLLIALIAAFAASAFGQNQKERILHSFAINGVDGYMPVGNVIIDRAGKLYGTTQVGGTGSCPQFTDTPSCGTVYELSPKTDGGWSERILHSFNKNGTDGTTPVSGLVMDASGNLYGTTLYGGTATTPNCQDWGCGTVFELSPHANGHWTEKILHSFNQDGVDGIIPVGGLIFDSTGNLYGATESGGTTYYYGTVYELSSSASGSWTEKILYEFGNTFPEPYEPSSGVVFDLARNLYGTTYLGGTAGGGGGTVFQLASSSGSWTLNDLHSFTSGSDGYLPEAGVVLDSSGNLYGTTANGGSTRHSGGGVVFEVSPSGGNWSESVLHTFDPNLNGTRGAFPKAGLIFDSSGNLYGTTLNGGTATCNNFGCGLVFELSPITGGGWSEKVLHNFQNNGIDGSGPESSLIFDAQGNLYGTASAGGAGGGGVVYEVIP